MVFQQRLSLYRSLVLGYTDWKKIGTLSKISFWLGLCS